MDQVVIQICDKIRELLETKESVLIAIDGRCGSGKTTLASQLKEALKCNVIPMDDFFLRMEQRTKERYLEPGGNVDRERFLEEVLIPLKKKDDIDYRPFDCMTFQLKDPIHVPFQNVTIVEGSYSCHPELFDYYDFHIFLTIDRENQLQRILKRNGEEKLQVFIDKWIPLEERYFSKYKIEELCERVYERI